MRLCGLLLVLFLGLNGANAVAQGSAAVERLKKKGDAERPPPGSS
jgi:hypothetical protein